MGFLLRRAILTALLLLHCIPQLHGRYNPRSVLELRSYVSITATHVRLPTGAGQYAEERCFPYDQPLHAQCKHTTEHCPSSDTFLSIPYLQSYFCAAPAVRPVIFAAILLWMCFLFSTLSISAADFFTPNLATLADLFGLDHNVAGVTLLAFGNGSPDLFSTFSAMRAHSGSLAIGELLGAASFIVSCVVGSMCIVRPFKVERLPFLRDVGFFTAAVGLSLVVLWDGKIVQWEAAAFIVLYVVYVVAVVASTWWSRKEERVRCLEATIRSEYADNTAPEPSIAVQPYRDDPSTSTQHDVRFLLTPPSPRVRAHSNPEPRPSLQTQVPRRASLRSASTTLAGSHSRASHMPSFSLLGALEFRQVVTELQQEAGSFSLSVFDSPLAPYAGGHYHHSHSHSSVGHIPSPSHRTAEASGMARVLNTDSFSEAGGSPYDTALGNDEYETLTSTPIFPNGTVSDGDTDPQSFLGQARRQRLLHYLYLVQHTLCPSLHNFKEKTFFGKVATVLATPAIMALTLTLPVVVTSDDVGGVALEASPATGRLIDFEEEGIERALIAEEEVQEDLHDKEFNKWLMATQCVLGPMFCAAVLFNGAKHYLLILFAAAAFGITLGSLVAVFVEKCLYAPARLARCLMGFFVAIVWIMAIADEVVNVLQTFGHIFNLSDAIIGLTLFAVGNSLADLVANTTIAVFAPVMGFSACFGGPMLNILLGVGISGTYMIHRSSHPYSLEFTPTLISSTIGLLWLLLMTLLFVPLNGYCLTKRWGLFLIASYAVTTTVNVVTELKS